MIFLNFAWWGTICNEFFSPDERMERSEMLLNDECSGSFKTSWDIYVLATYIGNEEVKHQLKAILKAFLPAFCHEYFE